MAEEARPPVVVLCSPHDEHALWLTAQLRSRGLQVEAVPPEALLVGADLTLAIGTDTTAVECRLGRGTTINAGCAGIVNRLDELPVLHSDSGRPADSDYLAQEWRAALASWLGALACPVLNPPTGASLYGSSVGDARWRALAVRLGLPVVPWSRGAGIPAVDQPATDRVFLVDHRVASAPGWLDAAAAAALAALSAAARLPLCSADFERGGGHVRFLRLDPLPPLALGGEALVAAVDAALQPA